MVGVQFDPFEPRHGHTLSWNEIVVEKGGTTILNGLAGESQPGSLTAVLGHSGRKVSEKGGKTTLLRALGGRGAYSSGEVKVDGKVIDPSDLDFQRSIAFVADHEVLENTATCYEAIRFSARLRLPSTFSEDDIDRITTIIVNELLLEKCKDTQCCHLSAGERRRVSLGIELVVRPTVAILDEPTSGLDSHNGMVLLSCLRKIADSGCCVMMSIHHPNLLMFNAIDHVMVLHLGRCFFQCNTPEVPAYFESRGLPVPDSENPADWMLTVTQIHDVDELQSRGFFSSQAGAVKNDNLDPTAHDSGHSTRIEGASTSNVARMVKENPTSFWTESKHLLLREARRASRDKASACFRLAVPFFGGVIFAAVFHGIADDTIDSSVDFLSHVGCLFFYFFCGFIVAPAIVIEFIESRPMYTREFRTGHYRIASLAAVSALREFLLIAIQSFVGMVVCFWSVGFQGNFGYLFAVQVLNVFSVTSSSILITSICRDPEKAKLLIGLEMFPVGLFCGFYVAVSQLPDWIQWPSWLVPMFYALRLFLENEFEFCAVPKARDEELFQCGKAFTRSLENSNFDGCFLSGHFGILIHSVSATQCDITTANILSSSWNGTDISNSDYDFESLFGARSMFVQPDAGDDNLRLEMQNLFWLNPSNTSYLSINDGFDWCEVEVSDFSSQGWAKDELDLFARIGAGRNMIAPAFVRSVPANQSASCIDDPETEILQTMVDMREFLDFDLQCYLYLQDFDATPDMRMTYWLSLLGLTAGLRVIGALLLRRNSYTNE